MTARPQPTLKQVATLALLYTAMASAIWNSTEIKDWLIAHLTPATQCVTLPSPGACVPAKR